MRAPAIIGLVGLMGGAVGPPASAAVTITTKEGDSIIAESITPQGKRFQVVLRGQPPRVVDPAIIERVDIPEPASFGEARTAYLAGNTVATLQAMGKLRAELEPFKNIAGGREWWLEAEFLRGHILLSQRREKEVEASMNEIAADKTDVEAQRHARVFLAHLTGLKGDPKKAIEELRMVIVETTDPDTLADAWLFVGQHYGATNDPRSALQSYLRVPVFYPGKSIALAGAQLGAARAFVALDEPARARRTLKELIAKLPNTAEAGEGRKLLAQVEKDLGLDTTAVNESKDKK